VALAEWRAYLESLDPEDREYAERLVRAQAADEAKTRAAPRATSPSPGYTIEDAPESVWPGSEPPPRRGKGRRKLETSAVRVYRVDDRAMDVIAIGNDVGAVRAFVTEYAGSAGYTVAEFLVPTRRGRLAPAERARYEARARCVHELRERGATLQAIADVLGVDKATVLRLARAGRL
jgi:hypothetical protein